MDNQEYLRITKNPFYYSSLMDELGNFSDLQKETYQKMMDVLKDVNDFINNDPVLTKFGIKVMIAGGSVRDLLLGNCSHIKDVDLLVSCGELHKPYYSQLWEEMENFCINNHIVSIEELKKMTPNETFYKMFEYIFEQKFSISQKFSSHIDSKEEYQNNYIISVIKYDTSTFPVDLILINMENEKFIEKTFDFDICKVGLYNKGKELRENMFFTFGFLSNVFSKEITYNVEERNEKEINKSLFVHLNRFLPKYAGYGIKMIHSNEWQQEILEKFMSYYKLSNIPNKSDATYKMTYKKNKL